MVHLGPAINQTIFEGRDDDVGLNSGTFNGGGGTNGDWTQDTDVNFRVRFVVDEVNGAGANNQNFKVKYNTGLGYIDVSATSPVQWAPTTEYADGDATTQVLSTGGFIAGEGFDDSNGPTANITFVANDATEIEICLTIDSAQLADSDTFSLRVYNDDNTALDGYTNTPTITVNIPTTTITMGAASVVSSAQTLTVVPGEKTTVLDEAIVASSAQTITVDAGTAQIIIPMDEAIVASSAETITLDTPFTAVLDEAIVASSAETITLDTPFTAVLDEAIVASSAEALTVVPGEKTTAMGAASVASSAETITLDTPFTTVMDEAIVASSAETLTVVPGELTTILDEAIIASSAETITVDSGAALIEIPMGAASVASSAETITLDTPFTTPMGAASVASSAEALTVVPGAVTIPLQPGSGPVFIVSNLSAETITVDVSPPDIVIPMDVAGAVLTTFNVLSAAKLTVVPGEKTTVLDEAIVASSAETIAVTNSVTIPMGAASVTSSAEALTVQPIDMQAVSAAVEALLIQVFADTPEPIDAHPALLYTPHAGL